MFSIDRKKRMITIKLIIDTTFKTGHCKICEFEKKYIESIVRMRCKECNGNILCEFSCPACGEKQEFHGNISPLSCNKCNDLLPEVKDLIKYRLCRTLFHREGNTYVESYI